MPRRCVAPPSSCWVARSETPGDRWDSSPGASPRKCSARRTGHPCSWTPQTPALVWRCGVWCTWCVVCGAWCAGVWCVEYSAWCAVCAGAMCCVHGLSSTTTCPFNNTEPAASSPHSDMSEERSESVYMTYCCRPSSGRSRDDAVCRPYKMAPPFRLSLQPVGVRILQR